MSQVHVSEVPATPIPNTHASHRAPPPPAAPAQTGRPAALAWGRDFAIVGGVSAFMTPFIMAGEFVGPRYLVFAATGGLVGGFFLGLLFERLTRGVKRRPRPDAVAPDDAAPAPANPLPLWLTALAAPLIGALWGGAVGLVAALGLAHRSIELVPISMTLAAIAGALQLGWFWAGYLFARVRRGAVWPVVAAACLLPIIGTASLEAVALASRLRGPDYERSSGTTVMQRLVPFDVPAQR